MREEIRGFYERAQMDLKPFLMGRGLFLGVQLFTE